MYATAVPLATLALIVHYFLLRPLYYYFRDPKGLRKYPSVNWLAGITNIGFMYEAFKGRRSKRLAELHKVHPVIRIGPNSLSFRSLQAIKNVYGHGTPCTKDYFYSTLSGTHFHLADVIDKQDHARKRKNLAAAYAIKNLEMWEHKVADKVERFIKACDAACTSPLETKNSTPESKDLTFDYFNYANFFTEDAIVDIGLSEKLGFLDQGSDECVAERMDGTQFRASYRASLHNMATAQSRIIWAYEWFNFNKVLTGLVSRDFARRWEHNRNWDGILYHRAKKRLARYQSGEKLDDFFQVIMEDKGGRPHDLPWGEIVAEISIMMNAGSDTTAIAMTNAVYLLHKHPQSLKTLREELDGVLDPDEVVAPYDKVKHLPYLRAVIDETLRMMPPVSFNLPRRTPAGGMMVASEHVAGHTSVSISAEVAHRDPEVFVDPDSFTPERWLGDKGRELQAGFVAFSAGSRGCIGRNITYLEQTMLLASVLHRYEMALPSPDWEPEQYEGTTTYMKELPLKVWRRELMLLQIPYAQGTDASTAEKGDEVKPTCGRCARKGIECVRPNKIRFKHWHQSKTSSSGFRSTQPWVRTDGALQFIDESHHIPAIYADSPESLLEEDATAISSAAVEPESSHALSQHAGKTTQSGQYDVDHHQRAIPGVDVEGSDLMPENGNYQIATTTTAMDQVADAALQTHISLEIENEIFGRRTWKPCPGVPAQASGHEQLYSSPLNDGSGMPMPIIDGVNPSASQTMNSDPGVAFELPVFPLQDPTEAKLFRQWIEHGARRFDMCDAHRHFATVLPVRAMTCKPLVNALFALSAKFSADVDDYIAAEYYQRCLNSLVPMLDQPAALVNEDLFAAVVLLRSFEELEVPLYGAYGETHLLGSHLFISASRTDHSTSHPSLLPDPSSLFNSFAFNGLRGAAFLVALRQELFIALVSQRPVLPAFSSLRFNRSLDGPTDDCAWANRIMPLAVDVLDFCYGENTTNNAQSVLRFDELAAYAERWFDAKPPTFDPVFIEEPSATRQDDSQGKPPNNDRSIYSSIWLLNDATATGLQNYYLIRILLSAFNPHMPRTGPTRTLFLRTENEEMRQHTRMLVGIARGNPMCVPLSVWAAVGIALAGDRFEDREEQDELIRFLSDTQASSMWDTKSSRVHLAEAWGWDVDTIVGN